MRHNNKKPILLKKVVWPKPNQPGQVFLVPVYPIGMYVLYVPTNTHTHIHTTTDTCSCTYVWHTYSVVARDMLLPESGCEMARGCPDWRTDSRQRLRYSLRLPWRAYSIIMNTGSSNKKHAMSYIGTWDIKWTYYY